MSKRTRWMCELGLMGIQTITQGHGRDEIWID
jgi:hypothetical protein